MHLVNLMESSLANDTEVEEFGTKLAEDIKAEIAKIFPKSWIESNFSTRMGTSISVRFTLGSDKQWANNILQNDDVFTVVHIWFEKDKLVIENGNGFSIMTKPAPDSYMAYDRVNVGWRKSTIKGYDAKKVLAVFKKNFTKLKKKLQEVGDQLGHYDLVKGNF